MICFVGASEARAIVVGRPNVLIILSDDQGYGDVSAHGNPVLKTPNLDKLRSESFRLTDFHVAPMCTPTRGQLLTGLRLLCGAALERLRGPVVHSPRHADDGRDFQATRLSHRALRQMALGR
ncbi:MAG: sulfatase-like hydrolase/transferase [Pirellulales bacterium]